MNENEGTTAKHQRWLREGERRHGLAVMLRDALVDDGAPKATAEQYADVLHKVVTGQDDDEVKQSRVDGLADRLATYPRAAVALYPEEHVTLALSGEWMMRSLMLGVE